MSSSAVILFKSTPSQTFKARLIDTAGVQVGNDITINFQETNPGWYRWEANSSVPSTFEGEVRILRAGDNGVIRRVPISAQGVSYPPPAHNHDTGEVANLDNLLAGKCSIGDSRLSDARVSLPHGHPVGDLTGLNKAAVGLGSVDNTADVDKPVSSAVAVALATKQNTLSAFIEAPNMQRIFTSPLSSTAAFLLVSGVAYFVYLGKTLQSITPKFVEFHVSTAGAGAQTAEVGLFSTPSPPIKAAQTFTKIVASGGVDVLTSTGVKRNTVAFATAVPASTHLWAVIRTAMATTQPQIWGLSLDMGQGFIQSKAAAGVLTGLTTVAANLIAAGTGTGAPNLRVTMD